MMMDIQYYKRKVERLEKVINMRECQLRCACGGLLDAFADSLVSDNPAAKIGLIHANVYKTLEAVDAIYDLHQGEKIENGFLGEPHKRG